MSTQTTFSIYLNGGNNANVKVLRNGEVKSFNITPQMKDGKYIIGFYPSIAEKTFTNVLYNAFYNTFFVVRIVFESIKMMLMGQVSLSDMSGPVGIVGEIGKAAKDGILYVLNFAALIAVNLGVMNLIPFPALDGGRIVFAAIEGVRGKPLKPELEGYVHTIGLLILFALMIVITFSDISKLFAKRR